MARVKKERMAERNLALGGNGNPSQTGTSGLVGIDARHTRGVNAMKAMEGEELHQPNGVLALDWNRRMEAHADKRGFKRRSRPGGMTRAPGEQF